MLFEERKVKKAAERFCRDINKLPENVKNESIMLIGPMGTGKSHFSKLLAEKMEMQRLSLDDRTQFKNIYSKAKKFKDFKNFEFALTGTVLSTLNEPAILDFGAGHSIYEEQFKHEKMQKMCKNFKNIILLLPSEDIEINKRILRSRRKYGVGSEMERDNIHFLTAPDNKELATKIIYENGKNTSDIVDEIIKFAKENNKIDIDI